VQDFTQAELALDLRVVSDPNALFYCGDTAQTISRGIAFRFTDIRTLLYDEGQRREAAAVLVKGPPPIKGGWLKKQTLATEQLILLASVALGAWQLVPPVCWQSLFFQF
jgi:hypothetical protein